MGLIQDVRNTLSKIRALTTGGVDSPAPNIPVVPGLGQLEVVDTNLNPTNQNIPGSWSRSWLGPGQPFNISDQSARDKDAETEPRTFQYISSVNSTISPRIAYGLTPFSELRLYAETVPEVAMCIRLLTEELKAFVPTIVDDDGTAVNEPNFAWMIERPDGFNPWPVWLSRFLYNVLVYDAGCAFWMKDSRGKIRGSRVIDGSTIFVVIDEKGEQPKPPAPSFQQIIWGMPKTFLNTKQLWYKPRHLRADAPYGRSPIEDSMPAVKLLAQLWDYEYQKYQVGNIPEMVFTVPPEWKDSADQILEYEAAFNARMSGSNQERARARFLPHGMEVLNTKELTFNKESYDSATNSVRMAFGILQSEVGDSPTGGLGGSGYAEAMQSAFYRMGLAPLISYVESHFCDILKSNGVDHRKFKLEFPPESLDPTKEEEKYSTRFQIGGISRDEYRQGVGMKPLGGDEGNFFNAPSTGGEEGDDGMGMPGLGKPGMIPVGNKNTVQVRRPLGVLHKPVGVLKKPLSVHKVDSVVASRANQAGFSGDLEQFAMGYAEEQEHAASTGGNEDLIVRIVIDHLNEDPAYYTKLKSVMSKFDMSVLQKHCGVCADDDLYYGAKIEIRHDDAEMPAQGANDSMIVSMGTGELSPRPGVWKPESGEDPKLNEWVGGKLFPRGEAAYILDRELAPDEDSFIVPVTYTVEIDGQLGSVQHYVTGRQAREEVSHYDSKWIEHAAILDYIIGQVDRTRKNWLTHPDDDKRPILIDSDLSFPVDENQTIHSSFVDAMKNKPISEKMCDMLFLVLGNHSLWNDLKEVLDSDEAVEYAKARAKKLYESKMIPMSIPVKVSKPKMILVKAEIPGELGEYIAKQPTPEGEDEAIGLVIQAYEELTGNELGEDDLPDEYLDAITELSKLAKWEESDHPRAKDGKFGDKGGGTNPTDAPEAKAKAPGKGVSKEVLDSHPEVKKWQEDKYPEFTKRVRDFALAQGVANDDMKPARTAFHEAYSKTKDVKQAYQAYMGEARKILKGKVDPVAFQKLEWVSRGEEYRFMKSMKAKLAGVEPKAKKEPKPEPKKEPIKINKLPALTKESILQLGEKTRDVDRIKTKDGWVPNYIMEEGREYNDSFSISYSKGTYHVNENGSGNRMSPGFYHSDNSMSTKNLEEVTSWINDIRIKRGELAPEAPKTKGVTFVPGKSIKETSAWVQKNVGMKSNLKGMEVGMANEWTGRIVDYFNEFPELKANFDCISSAQGKYDDDINDKLPEVLATHKSTWESWGMSEYEIKLRAKKKASHMTTRTPSNCWGYAAYKGIHRGSGGIFYNARVKKDELQKFVEELKKGLDRSVASKFHPVGCNTFKSVVDHEMGHQLDNLLGLSGNKDLVKIRDDARKLGGGSVEGVLSGYASKNRAEFIAEGWSEYKNNPSPRPTALAVGKLIEATYKNYKAVKGSA